VAVSIVVTLLVGCSTHVSPQHICGTYVATYPFGDATLSLQSDGTFVQTVRINGQSPATARGAWSFDPATSEVTLRGLMPVVDAFGHLERDWRAVEDFQNQSVEIVWFRTEIQTNESYGYIKQ
jgi:hypothetical protein